MLAIGKDRRDAPCDPFPRLPSRQRVVETKRSRSRDQIDLLGETALEVSGKSPRHVGGEPKPAGGRSEFELPPRHDVALGNLEEENAPFRTGCAVEPDLRIRQEQEERCSSLPLHGTSKRVAPVEFPYDAGGKAKGTRSVPQEGGGRLPMDDGLEIRRHPSRLDPLRRHVG